MPKDHQDTTAQNESSSLGRKNETISSHDSRIHISSINAVVPDLVFPKLTSIVITECDTLGTFDYSLYHQKRHQHPLFFLMSRPMLTLLLLWMKVLEHQGMLSRGEGFIAPPDLASTNDGAQVGEEPVDLYTAVLASGINLYFNVLICCL